MQIPQHNKSTETFGKMNGIKHYTITGDGIHHQHTDIHKSTKKKYIHETAQELQMDISTCCNISNNEPNRLIHILCTVQEKTVPALHNTADTQIRKHHILVSNLWKSEYFRK